MIFDLILISAFTLANLGLGFVVFARNKALFANKVFLAVTVFLTLWMLCNFFLAQTQWNLVAVRLLNSLAYTFGFLAIYASFVFATVYPSDSPFARNRRNLTIASAVAGAFALFSATPLIAGDVYLGPRGHAQFTDAPLELLYTVVTLTLVLLIIGRYVAVIRKVKGTERAQAILVMVALAVSILVGVFANLLLPYLGVKIDYSYFSPVTSLIVVGSIAYAITRHGLFNVRPFIARSLAYFMSIAALVVVFYGSALLLLGAFTNYGLNTAQTIYFAGLSVVLAIAYQPTKGFFDRISNRLFYRDSYDPQQVINKVNSKLVNTLNLHTLLHNTAQIIETEVGLSFCDFYLDPKTTKSVHKSGSNQKLFEKSDWSAFESYIDQKWKTLAISDNSLPEDVRKELVNLGIEAAVKMTASGEYVGVLIVGGRKSGNSFTTQDIQLLEIIAGEVAIAVQNALRFEVISQFNVTLQEKVDEATRKLRATNEKLRKLDETKDEFISMASHQLRTPLTSVKGYLSMVLEGDAGKLKPQQEALLKQSFLSSQRMVNLIADLLNLSRLNTGKFVIDAAATDLREVVDAEIAQLQEAARAKGIEMKYERPKEFPTLMLDENKIHQVVMNFMDNAIYYTQSEGSIEVSLTETPTAIEYRVKDTGIGVPRQMQKHLFSKFYRADNARRMRPDGTGLGIYMAKKVIVAQGGSIIFESEEGKGSTFGFRFSKTGHAAQPSTPPAT